MDDRWTCALFCLFLCFFFLCLFIILTHSSRNRSKGYANVSDSDDSETEEIDPDKLPALEVLPGEHKLQYNYCLWYHKGSMTKFKSPNVSQTVLSIHKINAIDSFSERNFPIKGLQQIFTLHWSLCIRRTVLVVVLSFSSTIYLETVPRTASV